MYFSRGYLYFIYFDVIIPQIMKKMPVEVKTCGRVQQLIQRMLRDLILQSRDSVSLNEDPPKDSPFIEFELRD